MTTDWYFVRDGARVGPRARDEVEALFSTGVLPPHTLVWRQGMENWQPAAETPEFGPVARGTSPLPPLPQPALHAADAGTAPAGGYGGGTATTWAERPAQAQYVPAPQAVAVDTAPHPWRRWVARLIDVICFSIFLATVAEITAPGAMETMSDIAINLVAVATWVPAEALVFAIFGSTLGKSLLRIRVTQADGSRLDFGTAFTRSFHVWMSGLAFGLPFISLITQIISYNRLTSDGITPWDRSLDLRVTHEEPGVLRWLGVVGVFLVLVLLIGLASMAAESP